MASGADWLEVERDAYSVLLQDGGTGQSSGARTPAKLTTATAGSNTTILPRRCRILPVVFHGKPHNVLSKSGIGTTSLDIWCRRVSPRLGRSGFRLLVRASVTQRASWACRSGCETDRSPIRQSRRRRHIRTSDRRVDHLAAYQTQCGTDRIRRFLPNHHRWCRQVSKEVVGVGGPSHEDIASNTILIRIQAIRRRMDRPESLVRSNHLPERRWPW